MQERMRTISKGNLQWNGWRCERFAKFKQKELNCIGPEDASAALHFVDEVLIILGGHEAVAPYLRV